MINPKLEPKEIVAEILALIKRTAADKRHPMHFIILSTLNKEVAEMRYVVWRKFNSESLTGQIFTDIRSNKIDQLKVNPTAQLLFYDSAKKLQIKVNVNVTIENNTSESIAVFKQMQKGAEAYNTLSAPGTVFKSYEETCEFKPDFNADDFAILKMKFLMMEVLELADPYHFRFTYNFGNEQLNWLVP